MSIEACRDKDQIWPEIVQGGQYTTIKCLAKFAASGIGRKWRIDDIADAGFILRPRAGIQGKLMRRTEQDAWIVLENILRSVSVMHVPINDCDALGTVAALRMAGSNRYIVEKAKTHRCGTFGMMSRR